MQSAGNVCIKIFEKDFDSAGVWNYDNTCNAEGKKQKPMYRNLRTNLPREIMGFREFPWGQWTGFKEEDAFGRRESFRNDAVAAAVGNSFATHWEVKEYLDAYVEKFGLKKYIHFGCEVTQLAIVENGNEEDSSCSWPRIKLNWKSSSDDSEASIMEEEIFDLVLVCNGHYSAPACHPEIDASLFQGKVMHAVEYDDPKEFSGMTVLCIGARASGSDLAREISMYADKVYLSDSSCPAIEGEGEPQTLGNVSWMPRTTRVEEKSVVFGGNYTVDGIDVVIFCNGYDYDFPFINEASNFRDGDNSIWSCLPGERRVAPLYKQLWHSSYPSLAFIGIPHSVVPFPLFELQAEAVCKQYKNLEPLELRKKAAFDDFEGGGPKNPGRIQDTHYLGSFQWDYCRMLSKMANIYNEDMERFISGNEAIYNKSGKERTTLFPGGPDSYRQTNYIRNEQEGTFETKKVKMLESLLTN